MKTIYHLKISTNNTNSLILLEALFSSYFPLRKYFKISLLALPRKFKKFVFIKSPHVNKKSKEHFQILTHKRLLVLTSQFPLKSSTENFFLQETLEQKILKKLFQKIPNDVSIVLKKTRLYQNEDY